MGSKPQTGYFADAGSDATGYVHFVILSTKESLLPGEEYKADEWQLQENAAADEPASGGD